MSNKIELKAGDGINLEGNSSNKTITIKTKVTDAELAKLTATGNDALVTKAEVQSIISSNSGNSVAPTGFPKFFTVSTESFIIPEDGRYKITVVGGGAAGKIYGSETLAGTNPMGGSSDVYINNTHALRGESGSFNYVPPTNLNIVWNKGGKAGFNGESIGGGKAGKGFMAHLIGGGGSSPLNYNVNVIHATPPTKSTVPAFSIEDQAHGYGAGGSGFALEGYEDFQVGGPSGVLQSKIFELIKNDILKILIGAGGNSLHHYISSENSNIRTGDGVQGAVLIEWVSK